MPEDGSFDRDLATALKFAEDLRDTGKLLQGGDEYPNAWGAIECSQLLFRSLERIPERTPDALIDAARGLANLLEDVCDNDFVTERDECTDAVSSNDLERVIEAVFSSMPPIWQPRAGGYRKADDT